MYSDALVWLVAQVIPSVVALLRCGARADMETKSGLTPLIAASALGKARSVEVLLKMGASPVYETKDGKTAAIEAVRETNQPDPFHGRFGRK